MQLMESMIIIATLVLIILIGNNMIKANTQEKPLEISEVNLSPKAVFIFKNIIDGYNEKKETAIATYNGCEYFMIPYNLNNNGYNYLPIHIASCTNDIHSHK